MGLFIYGTLLDRVMLARIAGGDPPQGAQATLADHAVLRQISEPLPYLTKHDGAQAVGMFYEELSPSQLSRLDAYETPFGYFRTKIVVTRNGQTAEGFAYFPDTTVTATDQRWDMAEWEAAYGNLSREMASEIGGYDPPLSPTSLTRQWPMIARRAAARVNAARECQPATVRHDAGPTDVTLIHRKPLVGNFFKIGGVELQHKTFAMGTSDVLIREVFAGTDASLLLPYDPATDHVLLVEQMRVGPLVRGAANPWSLEPIAGMMDGAETPEDAALREAKEEADLSDITLAKMFSVYASPGSSTDFFNCFLGLCDLPGPKTYTGGLDSEAEDLRLHILPFTDAMTLIDTGEITAGPLVMMLLWLDRNKPRLRSSS